MSATLYNQALKQRNALRKDLDQLSEALSSSHSIPQSKTALQGQVHASLASFVRILEDYEAMAKREIIPVKREAALVKLKDFRKDLTEIRTQLDNIKKQSEDSELNSHRSELFGRRAFSNSTPENPYAHTRTPVRTSTSREDAEFRESDFLGKTDSQLDDFISHGKAVLDNLLEQKAFVKNTQRRVFDVANTLGLSRDTIRFVERRTTQDKWIFWGGAIFTLVCFIYILKWFR
ncbi:Protein transport protein bos1 [Neolecta irregularis DAH-3]|uniref:Protein transport protein BOS1 n=1 Tax=Neolecta irregularis (strain DAH-3) TaxID=1198029 RepID=A0A1U7LTX7_NEOID|nr:Protein transport protein bos1 [Neolecta irregularis DAH-3]|eukprot:OLL26126.1 Protein transport protein bos1 [Neolecta irregularis DAH-3]